MHFYGEGRGVAKVVVGEKLDVVGYGAKLVTRDGGGR